MLHLIGAVIRGGRCRVNIHNCPDITESGESRRIAEQKAAELMINQLHKLPGVLKKRR